MISYKAVVAEIDNDEACVKLKCAPGQEGCAGCRLGALCHASEQVRVKARIGDDCRPAVGDTVEVAAATGLRYRAMAALLLMPLAVMILAAFGARWLGFGQLVCAVAAVLSLVPAYLAVYLVYGRGRRKHDFIIVDVDK